MDAEIVPVAASEIAGLRSDLVIIYRAVWTNSGFHRDERSVATFGDALLRHARRTGFRCFVAQSPEPVGFVYGYRSEPGGWWHDEVARSLSSREANYWLGDAFEFVELAVEPGHQRQGIGSRLHDELLSGVTQRTAVLSTYGAQESALRLYTGKGWETVTTDVRFPGDPDPYLIMGLELPQVAKDLSSLRSAL